MSIGRKKLTAEEIARRNQLIIQDMRRRFPVEAIAARHGVSERTVWTAWSKRDKTPALVAAEDAPREIQDHLDFLEAMQAAAAVQTETADQSSARLGFFKEELRIAATLFALKQDYGLIPQSAGELDHEAGLIAIRDKLLDVLERAGVPRDKAATELRTMLRDGQAEPAASSNGSRADADSNTEGE